ncbi:ATP-binding cassette domain-containing protein [Mycolicibacterium baixiangningiae]|uniref:ATP-binding cassette domain-containing protein n=1 Tax=Mycolicibacterium baixiangningiae TaxID=2761578 RepID=UPI0018D094B4|nr:ABC transporter ATP-binding protein [Mycolicibacterium baixiangningiae]
MSAPTLVQVSALGATLADGTKILDDVSISVGHGEIVGLIGESGSGKTTTALALLGFAAPGVELSGQINVDGHDVLSLRGPALRELRGKTIAYIPQDPPSALNPAMKVQRLIRSMLTAHRGRDASRDAITSALERVDLPTDDDFLRRFPHQLSGGQQQRLAIGAALAAEPKAVVLDEPTTGLDLLTQAVVLREIRKLRDTLNVSMVYVSHDLRVVADLADRVCVMYRGTIVEEGATAEVLLNPQHPYTQSLIAAIPDHRRVAGGATAVPDGAGETVSRTGSRLLEIDSLRAGYRKGGRYIPILDDVALKVGVGERVAVAGQSGSGKTTLTRCISGLVKAESGNMLFANRELSLSVAGRTPQELRAIQVVFQNPTLSLNPSLAVGEIVGRPIRLDPNRGSDRGDVRDEVARSLDLVELASSTADKRPGELSGGQRQRVMIASALAAHPRLLICDEITSALDVSVQAKILEMLRRLSDDLQLALLFVSHDLGVIAEIAHRTAVLREGRIVEDRPTAELLADPQEDYTRQLVAAADQLSGFTLVPGTDASERTSS